MNIFNRRRLFIVMGGLFGLIFSASACSQTIFEITWWDLLSPEERVFYEDYDPFNPPPESEFPPININPRWDGKYVKMPGYMVNLDGDFRMSRNFLLVPSAGACIHVPPPPENQIILVESEKSVKFDLYTPIWVYGVLTVSEFSNEYAEGLYSLKAEKTEVYVFEE